MNDIIIYVMAGVGTVFAGLWCFLFLAYAKRFDKILTAIDKKQFIMPELFFIGFGVVSMFKINLRTVAGKKREKKIAEIYGEKYAEFYRYVIVGGQITYALTLIPFGLFFGAIAGDGAIAFLVLAAVAVLVAYLDIEVNSAVERRREEILSDYPEVVSQLALLVNAGMIVRDAWGKVAQTANRPLYLEMQQVTYDMQNGISETDALYHFSQRCAVKEIRKFASMLIQNLQKGTAELAAGLKFMTAESWEEKKHFAKRKGEAANQKLLIPIMLMFIGVLMIVIVPIFSNIL